MGMMRVSQGTHCGIIRLERVLRLASNYLNGESTVAIVRVNDYYVGVEVRCAEQVSTTPAP